MIAIISAVMIPSTSPRVIVVTGAAGGIGTSLVEAFEDNGDEVIGLDIESGFDIRDSAACGTAARRIYDEYGRIDVLCNNAGVGAVGDVVDAPVGDWERVFAVNVFGLAFLSAAVLPFMRDAQSGAIVNMCSVAADVGLVERAVYSASKGAVLGLTKSMAADEARRGIRINCVNPGTVDGPWVRRLIDESKDPAATLARLEARQPLGRLVGADEVAAAVVYLAAPSTYTTGQELILDGGITGIRLVD
jgi:NAD(P)-dependent dehydrogenase (short-subunit alcohol dehydrogenase family)